MRIAIVGTGISGLTCAHHLHRGHDLVLFEAGDHVGGHTHTHDVEVGGRRYAVDTGFIVFNERTYPAFRRLLASLGVRDQRTDMSFGVRHEASGVEFATSGLPQLLAQPSNLLRPAFHRMVRDILRFFREAPAVLEGDGPGPSMDEYLSAHGYSRAFAEWFIVPMGAAVWSAANSDMARFPVRTFVRFFQNHGLLRVSPDVPWLTVAGGSARYVDPLVAPFRDRIRVRTPVARVARFADRVEVTPAGGPPERFDEVILAVHSDEALSILADPTPVERELLSAIPYQPNDTVLHTDVRLMPRARRAWASWNAHVPQADTGRVTVTYDMNRLQRLDAPERFLVTLNRTAEIAPERILRRIAYAHPVFLPAGVAAQRRHQEVIRANRTSFAGAWWGYGFHEDGVRSGLAVARAFGVEP
jgi:predicted NAD/FAD-binding protein